MRESLRRLASDEEVDKNMGHRRIRVELLDGEHITVQCDRKASGADLLDKVCETLDVLEKDYFGLLHAQRGDPRVWVDLNKRLSKTFRNEAWDVKFAVKFYPPEPSELGDENSRLQVGLAVRKDLFDGRLICSDITYALLESYFLQALVGDFCEQQSSASLLFQHRALPPNAISPELEAKIEELHRKHSGQTPAEAEYNYLENAKRLPLYGAELHEASDSDDAAIAIAVCAGAISVYRQGVLLNRFPWAKITKICYNKRAFTLRLRNAEFDEFEAHLEFRAPSTGACKKLWRCAVEYHMFFRWDDDLRKTARRCWIHQVEDRTLWPTLGEAYVQQWVDDDVKRETPVKVDRVVGFPRLGSRRLSCRRTLRQLREPATQAA